MVQGEEMETAVCRVLRIVAHEKRHSSKERHRRKAGVCRKARRYVCARVGSIRKLN